MLRRRCGLGGLRGLGCLEGESLVVGADLGPGPSVADESDLSAWIGEPCDDLRGPVDGKSRLAHARTWIIPGRALADNNLIERRVVIAEPRADELLFVQADCR